MITTASDMLRALKRSVFRGVILYRGPSLLDGSDIVVIANRITTASANVKTGEMVQTFIIRADVDPMSALASGDDAAVCGDCLHRPTLQPDGTRKKGSCYVNVGRSVMSVFGAFTRDRYAKPGVDFDPAILPALFAGLAFRIGTYGDPTAAPFQIWRRATLRTAAINGYSHQWRDPKFAAFKLLTMASCDTPQDYDDAETAGWRTFRVRLASEPLAKREVVCPASHEAGQRTTCSSCRACGGTGAKAKANIAIVAHGATAKRYILMRAAA